MLIVVLAVISFISFSVFLLPSVTFGFTIFSLLSVFLLFSISSDMFSLIFMQPHLLNYNLISDEFTFWLVLVCLIVVVFSFIISQLDYKYSSSLGLFYSVMALLFISSVVFSTSNLFVLYLFYEFSLIPIIYIIVKWGSYPDRFASSIMMLLYTTIVSFPLMVLVLLLSDYYSVVIFSGTSVLVPFYFTLVVFFAFSVKLPLYGIHYWLPIAHVEAPTFGSMVLAGILLKLGGIGLLRFYYVSSFQILNSCVLMYVIFALIIVSIVTSLQSDFKRLVAYSSVVHMSILVFSLVSGTFVSMNAFLMIIVLHGVVSPFMFIIVGTIYKIYSSRMLSLIHGVLSFSYSVSFLLVIMFVLNVPTPPFSSFVSEVLVFLGLVNYGIFSYFIVGFYVFLSIVFNVYWLSAVTFGSSMDNLTLVSGLSFVEFLLGLYSTLFITFTVFLLGIFYACTLLVENF